MIEQETKVIHSSFWLNFFNSPAEKSDLRNTIHSIPVFNSLSKRDISQLLNIVHNRNYLAGEYIFYQGDPGIGIYIILEGEVIIRRVLESKENILLATFTKGDFFGELALVDGEKRSASAIARTDTSLVVIFKPDLDEFIEAFPKKGIKILQGISDIIVKRLRRINEDYITLQSNINVISPEAGNKPGSAAGGLNQTHSSAGAKAKAD